MPADCAVRVLVQRHDLKAVIDQASCDLQAVVGQVSVHADIGGGGESVQRP